jgi:hypothetical protein
LNAGLPASSLKNLFEGIALGSFNSVPGITPAIAVAVGTAVKTAYSHAFKVVFLISIAFGVCFIAAALMSPNVEDYLTGEVARRLVKGQPFMEKDEESPPPEATAQEVEKS